MNCATNQCYLWVGEKCVCRAKNKLFFWLYSCQSYSSFSHEDGFGVLETKQELRWREWMCVGRRRIREYLTRNLLIRICFVVRHHRHDGSSMTSQPVGLVLTVSVAVNSGGRSFGFIVVSRVLRYGHYIRIEIVLWANNDAKLSFIIHKLFSF